MARTIDTAELARALRALKAEKGDHRPGTRLSLERVGYSVAIDDVLALIEPEMTTPREETP